MDRIRQLASRVIDRLEDALGRLERRLARANRRLAGLPLLLKQTFDSYNAHDGTFVSAAIAYYFFFTLFPLTLALVAIGSLFFESGQAQRAVIDAVSRISPGLSDIIASNIAVALAQRGAITVLATLGLIYSASGLFGVLLAVVNRIWACPSGRPSYIQRLLAIALVLILAAVFYITAFVTTGFQALSRSFVAGLGLNPSQVDLIYTAASIISSVVVVSSVLLVLYWKLPATQVEFGDAWPAAVAAGVVWEAVRELYAFYLSRFRNLTIVYGSLAAIIGLLSWFYLTGFIILLGGELSAQIAERRNRGPSSCRR
jgi:membrane protein